MPLPHRRVKRSFSIQRECVKIPNLERKGILVPRLSPTENIGCRETRRSCTETAQKTGNSPRGSEEPRK